MKNNGLFWEFYQVDSDRQYSVTGIHQHIVSVRSYDLQYERSLYINLICYKNERKN